MAHFGAVRLEGGGTGFHGDLLADVPDFEARFDAREVVDRYFDAENYFDLAATWQVRDTTRLRAGVNNILDNDPPLTPSAGTGGNGNTYPQLYDAMGRYLFFGLTQDF